jgi:hypothetical protein
MEMLDIIDAICSHYGETHNEVQQRWSWKLFCAKWKRLIDYSLEEEKKRDREKQEREFKEMQDATEAEHKRLLAAREGF